MRRHTIGLADLTQIALMTAVLEGAKAAASFLPNIEPVTLLLLLYTRHFGGRVFYVLPLFVLTEGLLYGFGLWWVAYLYVWLIPVGLARLFRQQEAPLFWAMVSGIYGLLFGALCALPTLCIGGPAAAFSWWIAGVPFDLLHGGGNFLLCLCLYRPLSLWMGRLASRRNTP